VAQQPRGTQLSGMDVPHADPSPLVEVCSTLDRMVTRLENVASRFEHLALAPSSNAPSPLRSITHPEELIPLIEARRDALRPQRVNILFISGPAYERPVSHFYLANSHLFRAIRKAFEYAEGRRMPNHEEFLKLFRERGCWSIEVPTEPKRGRGRPRGGIPRPGVDYVSEILVRERPRHIVAVRQRLEPTINLACLQANIPRDRLYVAPSVSVLTQREFARALSRMLASR